MASSNRKEIYKKLWERKFYTEETLIISIPTYVNGILEPLHYGDQAPLNFRTTIDVR